MAEGKGRAMPMLPTTSGSTPRYRTSTVRRYPSVSKWFHWTVAALVLVVWPLGAVIKFVNEDVKLTFYLFHESFGFVILWLMLARVAVRLLVDVPAKPPIPLWQKWLADSVQFLLYAALIAMPAIGFLATNAHGFALRWFDLFTVPSPIGKSPDIAPTLSQMHEILAWVILGLLALHLAGALYHQAIRRDHLLERMV